MTNDTALRRPSIWRNLVMFASVVGPGIITANADNDVGGIITYSQMGAQFGYALLWLFIPLTIALIVTQEMCARMGAITGKGLSDLIRENFGVKVTFWVLFSFVIADVGNTATEFAGVASAAPIFGAYVPFIAPVLFKAVLVIAAALLTVFTIIRGNYKVVERVFFVFCAIYLAYVFSGIRLHPNWHEIGRQILFPHFTPSKTYFLMIVAAIGTTVSPWMQFYLQAAIVDKGVREEEYPHSRIDVITGAVFADVIAIFILIASAATIYLHNQVPGAHPIVVKEAGDVAVALQPLAGNFSAVLFALGLLNAAIFTASILPLSTAYYVCEAFGFERGIDNRFRDAKVFYGLYLGLVAIGAGIVIIPGAPLLGIIMYSQVLNGALLPVVLVLILLLINNKRIMGRWTNSLVFNAIAWTTVIVVSVLTLISVLASFFPKLAA